MKFVVDGLDITKLLDIILAFIGELLVKFGIEL